MNLPASHPYALAIHTASPDLGLALSNFAGTSRSQTWSLGREVSTYLHEYLREFIQPQTWQELAFIAVAQGPGGFTGTRLGVVTARTLAQQLDIPLFGISTLAAAAWAAVDAPAGQSAPLLDLAVQLPAQRGEVHAAIYAVQAAGAAGQPRAGLQAQLADTVLPQSDWQQLLDGWPRPYRLVAATGGLGATAASLLELAYLEWLQGDRPTWSQALPVYGQSPV